MKTVLRAEGSEMFVPPPPPPSFQTHLLKPRVQFVSYLSLVDGVTHQISHSTICWLQRIVSLGECFFDQSEDLFQNTVVPQLCIIFQKNTDELVKY